MNHRIGVVAATLVLTACSVPIKTRTDPLGGGDRRLPTANTSRKTPDRSEIRRVCRSQRPAGWIAVDYVDDTQSCPRPKHVTGNGTAVMVKYTNLAVGRSLYVCSDQSVPQNWDLIQMVPDDASCPREAESTSTAPTVMEIRRVR